MAHWIRGQALKACKRTGTIGTDTSAEVIIIRTDGYNGIGDNCNIHRGCPTFVNNGCLAD